MIGERTRAGLAAAHKRGVAIGRPRALTPEQILMAKAMTADPAISIRIGGEAVWYPPLDALSAPQRASETLHLACKITPICLTPCIHRCEPIETGEGLPGSRRSNRARDDRD